MNDKQLSALLLLLIFAAVFWAYNTNKLSAISKIIAGTGGGTDTGVSAVGTLPGTSTPQQIPPVIMSFPNLKGGGSQKLTPLPKLDGVPTLSNPLGYNDLPHDNTNGLSHSQTTNAIADYSGSTVNYYSLPESALLTGVEGLLVG